jgi:putative intracellular protease/amidase
MSSILFVLTGAKIWVLKDGTRHPTGFWAEEFVAPHRVFTAAGVAITLATPGGVTPVVDELSLELSMNGGDAAGVAAQRAYLEQVKDLLANPVRLEDVNAADYDAIFVPGGHRPMQDLSVDTTIGAVLETLLDDPSKVVASVCHGPASFLPARRVDGSWLFEGRHLTAFTDEEETQAGFAANAPWLLETRLRGAGAKFDGAAAWGTHVVVDGNLVTGQNPGSAEAAAQAVLREIAARV